MPITYGPLRPLRNCDVAREIVARNMLVAAMNGRPVEMVSVDGVREDVGAAPWSAALVTVSVPRNGVWRTRTVLLYQDGERSTVDGEECVTWSRVGIMAFDADAVSEWNGKTYGL